MDCALLPFAPKHGTVSARVTITGFVSSLRRNLVRGIHAGGSLSIERQRREDTTMQPNPMQPTQNEPPHNPEDTPPSGFVFRNESMIESPIPHTATRPNRLSGLLRGFLILTAALITASAAVLYIQQGNAPASTAPPPAVKIVTAVVTATNLAVATRNPTTTPIPSA